MASRSVTIIPPSKSRSRVSNGRGLFVESNSGRSAWARRFRDLIEIYSEHIGGNPTPPQQSLIRRIATLDCETERMEGELAEGKAIDIDVYSRVSGNLRRLLEQLGFHAVQRRKPDSLADILARKAG